jgi:hypothetical protein
MLAVRASSRTITITITITMLDVLASGRTMLALCIIRTMLALCLIRTLLALCIIEYFIRIVHRLLQMDSVASQAPYKDSHQPSPLPRLLRHFRRAVHGLRCNRRCFFFTHACPG